MKRALVAVQYWGWGYDINDPAGSKIGGETPPLTHHFIGNDFVIVEYKTDEELRLKLRDELGHGRAGAGNYEMRVQSIVLLPSV
jgi:hypothetical protein